MKYFFEDIAYAFTFEFVQRAMIVGVLTAFCASLLGVTLVLKRFAFIGSGLSHVAVLATTTGAVIGFGNNIYFVLPVTIFVAILLLCSGNNAKIKGDSALAMISVGSLAMGYLILRMFSESANLAADICNVLFGSTGIVTISRGDLWLSVGLSAVVVVVFVLLYHKIFAITFDEDFAAATGTRARAYNVLLAIVVAIIIALAMNIVGALLVSALVVFPALTAMRVFKNFLSVTVCSVIVSMICAAAGILVSIVIDTPPGSTIVAMNIIAFILFSLAGLIFRRKIA
jgi:zinc transport system permease protein